MKHLTTVLLCVVALLAGLVLSYPLFVSNTSSPPTVSRPYITLEVPYAYFSTPSYTQNIIGLNSSGNHTGRILVDSIFVVKITNNSNQTVYIDGVTVYASSNLNITNTPTQFSLFATGTFLTQELAFTTKSESTARALPYLHPHESKLIALSGTTETTNITSLQGGSFYLGGKIEGSIGDWHSTWGGSRLVQVQNFGNEYLYNDLVSSNQTLRIQGNSVYIQ